MTVTEQQYSLFESTDDGGEEFPLIQPPSGWCFWCPTKFALHEPQMDHVIPKTRGGRITVKSCAGCNHLKSNQLPHDFVKHRIADLRSTIDDNLSSLRKTIEVNLPISKRLPVFAWLKLADWCAGELMHVANSLQRQFDCLMWLSRFGANRHVGEELTQFDSVLDNITRDLCDGIAYGLPDKCYWWLAGEYLRDGWAKQGLSDSAIFEAVCLFCGTVDWTIDGLLPRDFVKFVALPWLWPEWCAALLWNALALNEAEPGIIDDREVVLLRSRADSVARKANRVLDAQLIYSRREYLKGKGLPYG